MFIYLALLGLSCCTWGFIQLRRAGATLSLCAGLLLLQSMGSGPSGSGAVARGLSALQRVESSQVGDGASVCCIARQTLNHQAMREAVCMKYILMC